MSVRLSVLALLASAPLVAVGLPACNKSSDVEARAESTMTPVVFAEADAIAEQHDDSTIVEWVVGTDGKVAARVKADGKEVPASDVSGKLEVASMGPAAVPVTLDIKERSGLLASDVGPLSSPLTTVSYDLEIKGKPKRLKGAIHVPQGGTKAIVANAKIAAEAGVDANAKGPHGGVVQVVGEHLVEIVGQKNTAEVRVYLLDDDNKPIEIKQQKVKLGVVGVVKQSVELEVEPKRQYFVAKLDKPLNPQRVTVVVEDGAQVDVAVVGYRPGVVLVAGAAAPSVSVFVVDSWDAVVVVDRPKVIVVRGKHKGKGKGWGKKRGGVFIKVK